MTLFTNIDVLGCSTLVGVGEDGVVQPVVPLGARSHERSGLWRRDWSVELKVEAGAQPQSITVYLPRSQGRPSLMVQLSLLRLLVRSLKTDEWNGRSRNAQSIFHPPCCLRSGLAPEG